MKYFFVACLLASLAYPFPAFAEEVIDITFPVEGEVSFQDDFDDARSGHLHHATDIMAEKMSPVFAVVDGSIGYAPLTEPSYGFMLRLDGDDGYEYNYIHLNNDTPGTDDGAGDPQYAYAEGIDQGTTVERGQLIAYVGDSGNAEDVGSHLHFEIYLGDEAINPYPSLIAAQGNIGYDFDPAAETAAATSINEDQDIQEADGDVPCTSNTLIRTPEVSTVYYCGADGGRYLFQNESTFFSWYEDFDDVEIITSDVMGSIPLRGTVTYKPGVNLVKLASVPKVYAVAKDGTLRWIPSATIAEFLYGEDWAKLLRDVPDGCFPAYDIGEEVTRL